MAPSHSLAGLMKWLDREPWREAFADVLEQHVGGPSEAAGIEGLEELADRIGDHLTMTLWGCAFEDFLGRDVDDDLGGMAADYLKRRGWKESPGNRAYIEALAASVMSLYEVSDVRPGESFIARDLLRGGEPVRVTEHTATKTIKAWDRLALRLVELRGRTVMGGGVLPFSHELADELIGMIEATRKEIEVRGPELLAEIGEEVGDPEIGELLAAGMDDTELLRASAPVFSEVFLADRLDRAAAPVLPKMTNGDGEPMEFLTVVYRLAAGATAAKVRAALDGVPELDAATPKFWNWLAPAGEPPKRGRRKKKDPAAQTLATFMGGATVLGTIELKARTLELQVNSAARAERGQAMLATLLGDLVGSPLTRRQTVEQALAERPAGRNAPAPSGLTPEEERRIIHEAIDQHYRRQLDEPIPALDDLTPRRATRSAKGREKLVGWLKLLENHMAQQDLNDPMGAYDVGWMWDELGVADRRK